MTICELNNIEVDLYKYNTHKQLELVERKSKIDLLYSTSLNCLNCLIIQDINKPNFDIFSKYIKEYFLLNFNELSSTESSSLDQLSKLVGGSVSLSPYRAGRSFFKFYYL